MRIDKFLKVSRIIKRRSVAKKVANNDRIEINDKIAKASSEVDTGDIIKISFGNKIVTVKILEILNSTKKEDADSMFEILEETYIKD
ncbi:MAG: RNA-binding S4 domain-containing protein [Candidatus Izimaplasma sp.]|nr:RNA-binding S4 domain-containing protein [Candidatus Izimaplasma bacterium]